MLALPIPKRCAIHLTVIVLSLRSRRAMATFPASPLRRFARSASLQPSRCNSYHAHRLAGLFRYSGQLLHRYSFNGSSGLSSFARTGFKCT